MRIGCIGCVTYGLFENRYESTPMTKRMPILVDTMAELTIAALLLRASSALIASLSLLSPPPLLHQLCIPFPSIPQNPKVTTTYQTLSLPFPLSLLLVSSSIFLYAIVVLKACAWLWIRSDGCHDCLQVSLHSTRKSTTSLVSHQSCLLSLIRSSAVYVIARVRRER